MLAELVCFSERCRAQFPITDLIYNCPQCGSLLEVSYAGEPMPAHMLKTLWRGRRTSNASLDQSGVWRYREMIPFLDNYESIATLREGNTPLLPAPKAAQYGGLDGRLLQRRRIAAHYLHSARQHLLRQAGAGARVWREDLPGGGELRSDPG